MNIFLSPHFDDAIGSCGGFMAKTRRVKKALVLTIFAAIPKHHKFFVIRRIWENWRACRAIGAKIKNAQFSEARYRLDNPDSKMIFGQTKITETDLVKQITKYIQENTAAHDVIFAPSGLGNHIDHLIVNSAAKKLKNRRVVFYSDFCYDERTGQEMKNYWTMPLTVSENKMKIRAVTKYAHQMHVLFKHRKNAPDYFIARPYEKYSEDISDLYFKF